MAESLGNYKFFDIQIFGMSKETNGNFTLTESVNNDNDVFNVEPHSYDVLVKAYPPLHEESWDVLFEVNELPLKVAKRFADSMKKTLSDQVGEDNVNGEEW